MKKVINLSAFGGLIFFIFAISPTFAQEWSWSYNYSSSLDVKVNKIKYYPPDDAFISYTYFEGTVTIGSETFTSMGSSDILLTKFSSDGTIIWNKQFGGPGSDVPKDIFLNNNGDILLTGSITEGAVFDSYTLHSYNNSEDVFIAKVDQNGNVLWAKNVAEGNGLDRANSITSSIDGTIYIVGFFEDSLMFASDTLVVQKATANPFIAKFNETADYISSGHLVTSSDKTKFNSIAIANDGTVMLSGFYRDSMFLSTDTLVSQGKDDIAFVNIDQNTFSDIWVRTIGGTGFDRGYNAVTDPFSNYYLIGYFSGTAYVDSTGAALFDGTPVISHGGYDILVVKYNKDGRLLNKTTIGDIGNDIGYEVSINQNVLAFTGYFSGTLIFNNDTITTNSTSNNDILIGTLTTQGEIVSALSAQGDAHDRGQGIAIDGKGNGVIGGYFESTSLNIGNDTYSNAGGRDGFVAKYSIPFKIAITDQQDVSCNGGSDGSATVTPYFGTYPYTYEWSYDDGSADSTLTNVPAGDYGVKVTDAFNKTDSVYFTITQPDPIYVNAVVTDVSCANGSNGAIDISVAGGTPPYTYLWSTSNGSGLAQTQEDQTGLTAGDYTLRVTDDHGCIKDTTINVPEPDPITFGGSVVTDIIRPPGANGAIDLVVSGGTPDFTYYWEGPSGFSSTSQDLSNLDNGGTYTVTVTDHNSCTADTQFVVEDKTALVATIDSIKNITCYGNSDGYAHVAVTGGSGSYTYQWTNSIGTPIGLNSPSLRDVPAGTYYVNVTDNLDSRSTSTSATISQPAQALTIALTNVENITCKGMNDGKIDITVSGGWLPYTFSWTGSGGFTANTEDIADLPPGYYNVTISDNGGCVEQQLNIQITEPEALTVTIQTNNTILCNGELTGELEAMPTGGTDTYHYLWDDPGHQTTKKASFLEAGTYTVTVTDDNGCTAEATESLSQPDPLVVTAVVQDVSCPGQQDGSIILTVTGGTVPYTYLWTPGNITTKDITGISGGDYTINVTDSHNCTWDSTFTVTEPEALLIDSVSVTEISGCPGSTNGALVIHASGGTKPYAYSTDGGTTYQSDSTFTALGAGDYDIAVLDAGGCSIAGNTVTLNDPPGVVIDNVNITPVSCHGEADGAIVILASGGIEPYSYSIDGGTTYQADSLFSNLGGGNYDIAVRDPNGCVTFGSTELLSEPDPITLGDPAIDPTCPGESQGSIMVTATGGTGVLTFQLLNDQGALIDSSTNAGNFTSLDVGTYTITVDDQNHCGPVSKDAEVTEADNCGLVIYDAFSPNGDGTNEVWNIRGIQSYPNCVVKVFNSWGTQVFSSKGYTQPWDGTLDGKSLPAGTYYYIIDLGPGEKKYSGTVNIIK